LYKSKYTLSVTEVDVCLQAKSIEEQEVKLWCFFVSSH